MKQKKLLRTMGALFCVALSTVFAAAACGGEDTQVAGGGDGDGTGGKAGGDDCSLPLEEFCGGQDEPCPTWEKVRDDYEDRGRSCDNQQGIEYFHGRCGDFFVTEIDHEVGAKTQYFDESGMLVALRESTDVELYCDGESSEADFGTIPSCSITFEYSSCWDNSGGAGGAGR